MAELLLANYLQPEWADLSEGWLAFLPDAESAVGVCMTVRLPDSGTMLVADAITLPEYRRRGVFTSLLEASRATAQERGCRALIIRAACDTSGPICRKLGFEDLGTIERWWRPLNRRGPARKLLDLVSKLRGSRSTVTRGRT